MTWRSKVDVYSIYRETRSSDTQGASERHYAGWSADQDSAKRRAEEIYEGRDSAEAVVVIGNGPRGVEVLYRMDGED
jgi:NADH dehydrogenase FAD-containing subunit